VLKEKTRRASRGRDPRAEALFTFAKTTGVRSSGRRSTRGTNPWGGGGGQRERKKIKPQRKGFPPKPEVEGPLPNRKHPEGPNLKTRFNLRDKVRQKLKERGMERRGTVFKLEKTTRTEREGLRVRDAQRIKVGGGGTRTRRQVHPYDKPGRGKEEMCHNSVGKGLWKKSRARTHMGED